MESGFIKDVQITASSQFDGNHAAIQARLNFQAGGGRAGGWSSRTNNVKQWIQVDLASYTKVSQIVTQGRNAFNQWVTKYKLQYSDDGVNFHFYKLPGHDSPKVLYKTFVNLIIFYFIHNIVNLYYRSHYLFSDMDTGQHLAFKCYEK